MSFSSYFNAGLHRKVCPVCGNESGTTLCGSNCRTTRNSPIRCRIRCRRCGKDLGQASRKLNDHDCHVEKKISQNRNTFADAFPGAKDAKSSPFKYQKPRPGLKSVAEALRHEETNIFSNNVSKIEPVARKIDFSDSYSNNAEGFQQEKELQETRSSLQERSVETVEKNDELMRKFGILRSEYCRSIDRNFVHSSDYTQVKKTLLELCRKLSSNFQYNSLGIYDPKRLAFTASTRSTISNLRKLTPLLIKTMYYANRYYSKYKKYMRNFPSIIPKPVNQRMVLKSGKSEMSEYNVALHCMMQDIEKKDFDVFHQIGVIYVCVVALWDFEYVFVGKSDDGISEKIFGTKESSHMSRIVKKSYGGKESMIDLLMALAGAEKCCMFVVSDYRMGRKNSINYWLKKMRNCTKEFHNSLVVNEFFFEEDQYRFSVME